MAGIVWLRRFLIFSLYFISFAIPVLIRAQVGNQASIAGLVVDPSGAAVRNALVEVRNLNTSAVVSTKTNESGLFRFPILPVGTYDLLVTCAGWNPFSIKGIILTVGAHLNMTLRLTLIGPTIVVDVGSRTPLIETTRTAFTSAVEEEYVSNLPTNGRDFTTFALITPGVTRDARGGLSFGGQRAMNSLLVDGANNDDMYWGQPITGFVADGRQPYYLSQEAVQAFQVNTNAYSAEFGRAGGGVINTVTKSGSNQWHGSALWFYRDTSMNAASPINKLYGLPKDPFHFNQFGGTLGGPVRKDRLFFFINYEGMRSSLPNAVFLNLPETFQLSPDLVVAAYQQTALDYLRPRAFSWVWPVEQNDYLAKVDLQISHANRLAAVWARQRYSGGGALDSGAQNSFEHTDSNPLATDMGTVSLTSVISNNAINVARFSYIGTSLEFGSVGINPEANVFQDGQLALTIGRDSTSEEAYSIHQTQWSDTLSYIHGRHAFKFGADLLYAPITYSYALGFSGSYTFSSLESFGRSLSGHPSPLADESYQQTFSGAGTPGVVTHPNILSIAGFVQDEWRARADLTLNFGLRYELQTTTKPPIRNPSPALSAAGVDTSALPTDTNNVAPRLGIAWSPLGNRRLVLRGGYGVFYGLTPSVMAARAFLQNDTTLKTGKFSGDAENAKLIPAYPNNYCGAPDPRGTPPHCLAPTSGSAGLATIESFSRNYQQPFVRQASAGVEYELARELSVSATYLMTKGTDLQHIRDMNLTPEFVSGTIGIANTTTVLTYLAYPDARPVSEFDRILLFESSGSSAYNGLALQVRKRFSARFGLSSSYTFSKVVDNNPNSYALNNGPSNPHLIAYPTHPGIDYGLGDNDQRHRFVVSGIWQLGSGSGLPILPRAVLGNWQLSWILTAQSGQPYSGVINYDLNNDGDFATDRQPGIARNVFRLPTTVSLDPRLTRTFSVSRAKLQVIWESFNALNHSNITGVQNQQYTVSSSASKCGVAITPCLSPRSKGLSAFGTPTQSSGARIMQVAVKLLF